MAHAPRPQPLTNEPDLIDPYQEDWTEADDGSLWQAAQAGITPAVAEQARRDQATR